MVTHQSADCVAQVAGTGVAVAISVQTVGWIYLWCLEDSLVVLKENGGF